MPPGGSPSSSPTASAATAGRQQTQQQQHQQLALPSSTTGGLLPPLPASSGLELDTIAEGSPGSSFLGGPIEVFALGRMPPEQSPKRGWPFEDVVDMTPGAQNGAPKQALGNGDGGNKFGEFTSDPSARAVTYFDPPPRKSVGGILYETLRPSELLKRSAAAYYIADHPFVPPFKDPTLNPRLTEQSAGVLNSNPTLLSASYKGRLNYRLEIWDQLPGKDGPLEQENVLLQSVQGQEKPEQQAQDFGNGPKISVFGEFFMSDSHGNTTRSNDLTDNSRSRRGRRVG